jgi:hypothetical protein
MGRRSGWRRALAGVGVAVVVAAALGGGILAGQGRLRERRERDDVRRFTTAMRPPLQDLAAVAGGGLGGQPGFGSAVLLLTRKGGQAAFERQTAAWQDRLRETSFQVRVITVGRTELFAAGNGRQRNSVGGRVRSLSSVRDNYAAAVDLYVATAELWQLAASAPAGSTLQIRLANEAGRMQERGQVALNSAAMELLQLHDRYHLNLTVRMPGESQLSYRTRYVGAP